MLQKQPVAINFAQGLSQKGDPKQLTPGKFIALNNAVQNKLGLLEKRNGNLQLASLPTTDYSYLTTFNNNLTAISSNLAAYIQGQSQWVVKGEIQPLALNTLPLIRTNTTQTQSDIAISASGLICTAYTDAGTPMASVADATTGQNVVPPFALQPDIGGGATVTSPRVFVLGNYFIVVYISDSTHLAYTTINLATRAVSRPVTINNTYSGGTNPGYDGVVLGNNLYLGWNTALTNTTSYLYITAQLVISTVKSVVRDNASLMSMAADTANAVIWATFISTTSNNATTVAFDPQLNILPGFPVTNAHITSATNITSAATGGVFTYFIEQAVNYNFTVSGAPTIPSNWLYSGTLTQQGLPSGTGVFARSVGLASKPVVASDGNVYVLAAYQSPYQSTYYLLNPSGNVAAQLAYSNGAGYSTQGLSNMVLDPAGNMAVSYLYADSIQAVNKNTNIPAGNQVAGVYSQFGINLATFELTSTNLIGSEIGNNLNLNAGFLWGYDGYVPTENNFFVWPDSIQAQWSNTGGNMTAQPNGMTNTDAYYYQVTYEWTDMQGNAFRSAPSIPVAVTTTGSGNTGSVLLNIPKLRLTYKTANPVKICMYRWSVEQQSYYQTTSITVPVLNNSGSDPDLISVTDTNSDPAILGNNLIYTTGGVVENIGGPSFVSTTLFDTRLWGIDSEDQNLLWFSKQVIEATPVEMSDLFTLYVPPSTGTGGSTGPMRCLAPMDDKLIIFKDNAIYYVNGTGPDNTGANNQYSQATFITSTIGCSNQRSIVLTPNGIMFQSNNGIWLLGRDLSTTYIGNPVSDYNSQTVLSALNIPETNQIRFNLDNDVTLVYNYFFDQWGTFTGIAPVSSAVYNGLTAFIDSYGQTFVENPGSYLDGSNPVLINLTTSWFNLGGLQGFQRFYYMQFLGTYYSPHTLEVSMAYDYASGPSQTTLISPLNYSGPWGSDAAWGTGTQWGNTLQLEQWQVFPQIQKCQAVQISIQERYDSSYGVPPGAGFDLSGINMIIGVKKGYAKLPASNQAG